MLLWTPPVLMWSGLLLYHTQFSYSARLRRAYGSPEYREMQARRDAEDDAAYERIRTDKTLCEEQRRELYRVRAGTRDFC